jgi:hypothetical protein
MPAVGDARERHSVKFYLVAMISCSSTSRSPFSILGDGAARSRLERLLPDPDVLPDPLVGYVYVWRKGVSTGARAAAARRQDQQQRAA